MGSVLRRLLFFFQRNQFDRDLEDELRFHEEMKAHALADADGMWITCRLPVIRPGGEGSHTIARPLCKVTWTLGQVSDIVPRGKQESQTRG